MHMQTLVVFAAIGVALIVLYLITRRAHGFPKADTAAAAPLPPVPSCPLRSSHDESYYCCCEPDADDLHRKFFKDCSPANRLGPWDPGYRFGCNFACGPGRSRVK